MRTKLIWAGLNLATDDLPKKGDSRHIPFPSTAYPIEMTRALVITWLFAGLRRNEIVRLRVGCIRWQKEDVTVPGTGDVLPAGAGCRRRWYRSLRKSPVEIGGRTHPGRANVASDRRRTGTDHIVQTGIDASCTGRWRKCLQMMPPG